jgi:hypothetical protein
VEISISQYQRQSISANQLRSIVLDRTIDLHQIQKLGIT